MEIVNWLEHSRAGEDGFHDMVAWLIIHSIGDNPETMKRLQVEGMKSDALQIELKVNGIEVPFVETLRRLETDLDNMISRKAKDLIKEKFANLDNTLYNFQEMLQDSFREAEKKVREEFRLPFEDDRD